MCFIVGKHKQHECVDLEQARKSHLGKLSEKKGVLNRAKNELEEVQDQLKTVRSQTEQEEKDCCTAVNARIDKLHTQLEDKRAQICKHIREEKRKKVSSLDVQMRSVAMQITSVEQALGRITTAERPARPVHVRVRRCNCHQHSGHHRRLPSQQPAEAACPCSTGGRSTGLHSCPERDRRDGPCENWRKAEQAGGTAKRWGVRWCATSGSGPTA
eukprot:TRINITY_DN5421_c0_g1_i5.p1 TRINITY_DN5421_c0_g1~~TRINITY_DN5421_c0_g1_i5.p1  ORF type:complete len:214 (-),score=27.72 TRINITY_DN5421_c0_g1_i5:204-845(-)